MENLHQLHDRMDGVTPPRAKPHNFQITAQAAKEWRRELEAAMDRIAQVAKLLDADAEEMEREDKAAQEAAKAERPAVIFAVAQKPEAIVVWDKGTSRPIPITGMLTTSVTI